MNKEEWKQEFVFALEEARAKSIEVFVNNKIQLSILYIQGQMIRGKEESFLNNQDYKKIVRAVDKYSDQAKAALYQAELIDKMIEDKVFENWK